MAFGSHGVDVARALEMFRKALRHMALVRGDEGKVLGLITLEDIMEEIVGEIEDEHDQPNPGLAARTTRREPRLVPQPT